MKILGIPVKNRDLGSCRLRYYSFLDNLPEGWMHEKYSSEKDGDILYIQKAVKDWTLLAAKQARKKGMPVVFDRDDFQQPWHKPHSDMMDLADAVTTDTEANAELCRKHTKTPVYVVPDGLDYNVKPTDRAMIRNEVRKVVTYGRQANVMSITAYYKYIKCNTVYICDRRFNSLRQSEFYMWNRKTFLQIIKGCDAVLLTHNKDFRVIYKPPTRALVAMSIGLPVLVSMSPEFKRVVTEAGHPELIIKKPTDVTRILKEISSQEKRQKIGDDLHAYTWKNYSPQKSSQMLADIMTEVINA